MPSHSTTRRGHSARRQTVLAGITSLLCLCFTTGTTHAQAKPNPAPPATPKQATVETKGPSFDLIIRGGSVHDGKGIVTRQDIGITGARITALGDLNLAKGKQDLDASQLIIAPGFIDVHAHADRSARRRPRAENYLAMGVTSIVTGNCGRSELDLETHFRALEKNGISINYASLIGHGSVRSKVMGNARRAPTDEETLAMQALVRRAMQAGALGMSTGLIYVPGTYAETLELIELAKVVSEFDGIYASHMRNEAGKVLVAINEALRIGKTAKLAVHLSHLKASGKPNWGRGKTIVARLREARDAGQKVTGDQYAYTASSTSLDVLFPSASFEIGRKAFAARLENDPAFRQQMSKALHRTMERSGFGDLAYCQIATAPKHPELNGETIRSAAKIVLGKDDRRAQAEMAIRLIVDAKGSRVSMVYHKMCEEDVETIMKTPFIAVAADAGIRLRKTVSKPHPRGAGNNARVLGRYVRERKTLPLALAITKMTSLPAAVFGLPDRGTIRVGAFADLVIFDANTVIDGATYKDPLASPKGISQVIVNGVWVIRDGEHTGARPGQVLRKRSQAR